MNEKHFKSFAEEISAEFGSVFGPGWMPRNYVKIAQDVRAKRDVMESKKKSMNDFIELSRENHTLGNPQIKKYIDEYIDEYGTALRDYNKALKSLTTGEVFGSKIAFESSNYIPCDSELSLADLYGIRYKTDGKAPRVVFENYTDESKAGVVTEGTTIPTISALDCVGSFSGSLDEIDKLACVETAPEYYLEDDPVLAYNMVDRLRFKHIANAENYILCVKILGSKEAVSLASASDLLTLPALSAKAKRGAEIITNETGFAKLDVSDPVSGKLYIKKDFQIGEFVYRDRYIIRVLPDSILANNENETAPVLLGDWKNILRYRFAPAGLFLKQANICADIPLSALSEVDMIKKLTGEDTISADRKFKDPFTFRSYARLFFSANSIPYIDEKTNAFYRRMLILKMESTPKEVDQGLFEKLRREIPNIITRCVEEFYCSSGEIDISDNSREAVKSAHLESDSVEAFIVDRCEADPDARTERHSLYDAYKNYCFNEGRRELTPTGFYKALANKGYKPAKGKTRDFLGLKLSKVVSFGNYSSADFETDRQIYGR